MGLFRVTHLDFEEKWSAWECDTEDTTEWQNVCRLSEPGWGNRYDYEASLINDIIDNNNHIKNVLEIGSGPGELSQRILKQHPDLEYHLIDKPFAKKYFEEHDYTGTFFVKDLSNSFDKDGLLESYDLVIINDFLEHVFNPHAILKAVHELTTNTSILFISNPNWRMGHTFIYRGVFDFDNFIYMLYVHLFKLEGIYGSILKTPPYPKISSETLLPDEHLADWNHYMIFKQR